MTDPNPSILVTYNNEPVALVNARHVDFLPPATELPAGHPRLRLFMYMARYAQLIVSHERPGPYTDADGERFARTALIDASEFRAHREESDDQLAERFKVPIDQIPRARQELLRGGSPIRRPHG